MSSPDEHKKDHPFYRAEELSQGEDEATAEAHLIANLEEKRHRVQTSWGDNYTAAVPGERPLLGTNVNVQDVYKVYDDKNEDSDDDDDDDDDESPKAAQQPATTTQSIHASRLRDAIQKTMQQRRASLQSRGRHNRKTSDVQSLLEFIQEDNEEDATDSHPFAEETSAGQRQRADSTNSMVLDIDLDKVDQSHTDRLVAGAMQVQSLFEEHDSDIDSTASRGSSILPEEFPLLPSTTADTAQRRRRVWYERLVRRVYKKSRRRLIKFWQSTVFVVRFLWHAVITAYFCFAAIPLFVTAWIFFYYLGNPHFDFLPGNTTMSWWLNFTGRQLLTLEMARMAQFFIIDGLTLRSKIVIQLGGPLLTLLAIQARGWPFILSAWSLIDLLMLHGDTKFPRNWFYWTGLDIYSSKVTGIYILNSDLYFRSLMCLLVVGGCVSVKRSAVAIYFGRKTLGK